VEHEGFRLTTVPRTLLDLGTVVGAAAVERSLESALRRRLAGVEQLTELCGSVRSPGSRVLRDVLRLRPEGAPPTGSDPETRFVQIVRGMGFPPPRRQFVVIFRGRKFRIDFAWPALRLAVEIDGASVHTAGTLGADLYRQNQILLDGWLIVRFTPYMVERQPQLVERDLRAAWELRSTTAPASSSSSSSRR
jgi:very-short-patch-repair endonuclease